MVFSHSWQAGRQSPHLRPSSSPQLATVTCRRSNVRATSGAKWLPAFLLTLLSILTCEALLTLPRFTAASDTPICNQHKRAFVCSNAGRSQRLALPVEHSTSLRSSSGENVSTSNSQPDADESEPTKHAHERNTSWTRMVLALPLELAAVNSRTDNFYLRKRKRKHWWSVGHFPKVCTCGTPAACSQCAIITSVPV